MSETKFMPGPWKWIPADVDEYDGGKCARLLSTVGEVCNFGKVTTYYPSNGEEPNDANASLIACAPDLYEATKMLADALKLAVDKFPEESCEYLKAYLDGVYALLAKARGEQ